MPTSRRSTKGSSTSTSSSSMERECDRVAGKMYQMVVPHEAPNGQTYWKEVGVMFPREKGGYMVRLHLLPGVSILVTEMREKEKKDGAPEPAMHRSRPRSARNQARVILRRMTVLLSRGQGSEPGASHPLRRTTMAWSTTTTSRSELTGRWVVGIIVLPSQRLVPSPVGTG